MSITTQEIVDYVMDSPSNTNPAVLRSLLNQHNGSGSSGGGEGLSDAAKLALLNCFNHVAWTDDQGQTYYDALEDALYPPAPPATLLSIAATYTQSGTVYDTDSLDSLKDDLVVTASWSDGTTTTLADSDYTLSGTLTVGTSTITVSYGGKSAPFNVVVTHLPSYVTSGLIHQWDGINNTGNGHDSSALTWKDIVGDCDLSRYLDGTWTEDSLSFNPSSGSSKQSWESSRSITASDTMTIEMCIEPTREYSSIVAYFYGYGSNRNRGIGFASNDVSVGGFMNETNGFATTGLSSVTGIKSIVATYTTQSASSGIYVNGVSKTKNANHSFGNGQITKVIVGGYGSTAGNDTYPFGGKIHAIRIYNRVLTAEEIAQNYAVDVNRFGLEA